MNTVDKVLKIAMNEVGYLEKSKTAYQKNHDIIYEKTAGAGSDNITVYGYEMHQVYPSVMDFPAYWCFVAGTMVLTDGGYKPIEDIAIGDKVLNAYGNRFNTVVDIATRTKRVRSIKAYGSLKMQTTDDHPFLGNQRLGVRKDWKHTELDFYPASEFSKGDNVIIPTTSMVNDTALSYDEAWVIGYFVGDGWKTNKDKYRLCGNARKEEEILKHIASLKKDKDYQSRTCYEYEIDIEQNGNIIPYLDEAGRGAINKVVPASIIYANNDIKEAFLNGYMTADGNKGVRFSTVSKQLALGIAKICFDIGYGCALREVIRDEEREIYDKRINAYRKVHIQPVIYCGQINRNHDRAHRLDRRIDNLVYVPIKENVSSDFECTVYNISTDGDHTFLANNLAVHNCDAFVDWCFYKAYGVTTAKSLLGGNFDDYTVASSGMYAKHNALDTNVRVGDQVFFTKNGKTSGCHHTGLVYQVDSEYFYTIEGNTSNANTVVSNGGGVAKKRYKISDYKGKVLFGHPKYDIEKKNLDEIAKEVIDGKWGSGAARRANLTDAGYNYALVQAKVNELLKPKEITDIPKFIWDFLMEKIKNAYGVAGLMGNLKAESGLNPKNLQNSCEKRLGMTDDEYVKAVDNGTYKNFAADSCGFGLAQWTSSGRKRSLYEFRGNKSIGDLEMQMNFLYNELCTGYKSTLNGLKGANSVREASDIVLTKYERPKDQSEGTKKYRASLGQEFYDKYKG